MLAARVGRARIGRVATVANVARQALVGDFELLKVLESHIVRIDQQLARLLPAAPYQILTDVPGCSTVRASGYAGAVGDLRRWPSARQVSAATEGSVAKVQSPCGGH